MEEHKIHLKKAEEGNIIISIVNEMENNTQGRRLSKTKVVAT